MAAENTALTALLTAREQEVDVRRQSVLQAEEAARVLSDRYTEQLAPLAEVLEAEAVRAREQAALRRAEVEVVRTRLRLAYAGVR